MAATQDEGGERRYSDQAKAAVVACVECLVRDGLAQFYKVDSGVFELTLSSGEVFHLGKTSVTRIV
jgi:hypothetical protein